MPVTLWLVYRISLLLPVAFLCAAVLGLTSLCSAQDSSSSPEKAKEEAQSTLPAFASSPEFLFSFLEYRYGIHRRVVKRWEGLLMENQGKVLAGKITLDYFINPQGFITIIEPKSGFAEPPRESNMEKLAKYALALENESPTAFPEVVKEAYPNGYFYQITLSLK
ncbi:MAG: hypothetical protein AAF558_02700 [Verrucomicrobiota bacterium]